MIFCFTNSCLPIKTHYEYGFLSEGLSSFLWIPPISNSLLSYCLYIVLCRFICVFVSGTSHDHLVHLDLRHPGEELVQEASVNGRGLPGGEFRVLVLPFSMEKEQIWLDASLHQLDPWHPLVLLRCQGEKTCLLRVERLNQLLTVSIALVALEVKQYK